MRTHPWRLALLRCRSRSQQLYIPSPFSHSPSHPTPPLHFSTLLRSHPLSDNPSFRFFSSSELTSEDKNSDHVGVLTDILSRSSTGDEIKLELDSNNIVITHDLVIKVLQGVNSAPDTARKFFDYVSERESERLSSKSYNWMLGILGSNGNVKEFWDLVGIMKEKGYGVKKGACVRALEKFEKGGLSNDVEDLKNLYASGSVDDSAEKVSSRVCNMIKGEAWGDEVEKCLLELNVLYSSDLVSRVLGKVGQEPNKALIFFRWLQESKLFEHDESTYNAMVRVLGREDCIEKFWRVLDELRGAGFEIVKETYIEVLGRFIKRRMMKDAVELFECVMGVGNKPPVRESVYLLKKVVVSKEIDMDLFLKVVKAFTAGGYVLTDSIVGAIMNSLSSVKRFGECNKILKAMEESGFLPSDTLRSKIAFQLSSKGKMEEVNELVDNLEHFGSNSNYKTWASLVQGCCVAGRLDEALDVFQKMVEKEGVSCAGYVLETLVKAYCKKNRAMDACNLVVDMVNQKQLKPWHSTYKLLTRKVLVQGGLKEALELLGCMKIQGFPPFLDPFIDYLSKRGTADEAKLFLKGMTVQRVPSTAVFLRVFEAYLKTGRHNEAHSLLSKCPLHIRNQADILDLFFTLKSEAAAATTCVAA